MALESVLKGGLALMLSKLACYCLPKQNLQNKQETRPKRMTLILMHQALTVFIHFYFIFSYFSTSSEVKLNENKRYCLGK